MLRQKQPNQKCVGANRIEVDHTREANYKVKNEAEEPRPMSRRRGIRNVGGIGGMLSTGWGCVRFIGPECYAPSMT